MSKFKTSYNRFKHTWSIGLACRALLYVCSAFVLITLLIGVADFLFAFGQKTRTIVYYTLLVSTLVGLLVTLVRSILYNNSEVSALADRQTNSTDRIVSAAFDLQNQESPTDLHAYLKEKALVQASSELQNLSWKSRFPWKALSTSIASILITIGILGSLSYLQPSAYTTVKGRILTPEKDIAPFTNLRFKLEKENAITLYGGENSITTTITGDEIEDPVYCLIKNSTTGEIEETETFQKSDIEFTKKFSKVVEDFEIAFTCGKARSQWLPMNVMLQPKFGAVQVTITPPKYTKKPQRSIPLDGNLLSILEGSKVVLDVTSNRPLAGGSVTLSPFNDTDKPIELSAESAIGKSTQFQWFAHRSTSVSCAITDIQGTHGSSPLTFNIQIIPDEAPAPELTSPSATVLATPDSIIPLQCEVTDDHGLKDVSLVRSLVGFRDRSQVVAADLSITDHSFTEKINLGALGVLPKQDLEFYLEATDLNPSLLGSGTSNVVRVHIISVEEYAERIRRKTTLKAFAERFKLLSELIENARDSLVELETANKANKDKEFNATLESSKKWHEQSKNLAYQLARDFHAYALEKELGDVAAATSDVLNENFLELQEITFSNPVEINSKSIEKMLERLGGVRERAKKLKKEADQVNNIGEAIKLAVRYREIYSNQRSVTMRFTNIAKEIHKGITRNARQLPNLAKVQMKNRDALLRLLIDIRAVSESLPDEFGDLKMALAEFADKADELNIVEPMQATADAAKLGKSDEATSQSHFTLNLLEQLLQLKEPNTEDDNAFAALCQGKLQRSKFPVPDKVEDTLTAMLRAMLSKVEKKDQDGEGGEGGPGEGGEGGGGQAGRSANNLPMFGPPRLDFNGANSQGRDGLAKKQGSRGKQQLEQSQLRSSQKEDALPSKLQLYRIPEKYKDSVKKFQSNSQLTNP